ncbi:hypothetical protein [Nocardiopsis alkaliphila]
MYTSTAGVAGRRSVTSGGYVSARCGTIAGTCDALPGSVKITE